MNNGFNVAFIPMLVGANVNVNNLKPGIGIGYGSSTAGGSTKGGFLVSPQLGYSFKNIDFVAHYTSTNTNVPVYIKHTTAVEFDRAFPDQSIIVPSKPRYYIPLGYSYVDSQPISASALVISSTVGTDVMQVSDPL